MRIFIIIGFVALLAIGGILYFNSGSQSAPPPPDATARISRELRQKFHPGAGVADEKPTNPAIAATTSALPLGELSPSGLAVTLTSDGAYLLTGNAINSSSAEITLSWPVGTSLANDDCELVLSKPVEIRISAGATVPLSLTVVRLHATASAPVGNFTLHSGIENQPKALLDLLAQGGDLPSGALQAAVLVVNDNVSLDRMGHFRDLLPDILNDDAPETFHLSTTDILGGLSFLQKNGYDISRVALMADQRLKMLAMLDPDSHSAALELFNISTDREWSFWKYQLLQGDFSLRPEALFGIAQHYPEIALEMMPKWVRETKLTRDYRYSAARALAFINDSRSRDLLMTLRDEHPDDVGLSQNIERAIRDWDVRNRPKTSDSSLAPSFFSNSL